MTTRDCKKAKYESSVSDSVGVEARIKQEPMDPDSENHTEYNPKTGLMDIFRPSKFELECEDVNIEESRTKARVQEIGNARDSQILQALARIEQRPQIMREHIERMSEEQVRSLLQDVAVKRPSLLFDFTASSPGSLRPPAQRQPWQPDWCKCGQCQPMPTVKEQLCCGCVAPHCISLLPDFEVFCLDEGVLHLGKEQRNNILASLDPDRINAANREQGLRNFIYWRHGQLAVGDKRVVPSCCVLKIRDKFPDPFNQYTGYVEA